MNNEPVAWMNEPDWMGGVELDVITDEFKQSGKGGDCSEYSIPLYTHPIKQTYRESHEGFSTVIEATHPVKEQDESFDRTASHMAGEYVSYKQELTDEEINVVAILQDAEIVPVGHEIWKTSEEFNKYKRIVLATAKALRKAQE